MILACIISLGGLIIIEFFGSTKQYHPTFIYDICLAVFGGSLILLIVSIIEFDNTRRMTMESFYQEVIMFRDKFAALKVYDKESDGDNFDELLRNYIEYSKLSVVNLGNKYAQLHFIFGHRKKQEWINTNLYRQILDARDKILEGTPHFEFYLQVEDRGNKAAVSRYLTEIQNHIFSSEISVVDEEYKCRAVFNNVVDALDRSAERFRMNIYGKWSIEIEDEDKPKIIFSHMWKR
jgi:hypothetical protein